MIGHESLISKYTNIFLVVSAFWIVSISTVFVNKVLLSDINLDAPIFIAFYQALTSASICFGMKMLSPITGFNFPQSKPFDLKTIKDVIPLTIMFTTMIVTNNLCLKYVSIATFYIVRSLTTVFNVVFTYLILGEKTTFKCTFCCFIIMTGFYLGMDQESSSGSFSLLGTIFGVTGSVAISLYSIFTTLVLPKVDREIWLISYYNNIYASIIYIPMIFLNGEQHAILNYDGLFTTSFWAIMTIGGVCAFSVGYLTSLQIKVTSPLTHNISGTAKACAQTVLATYWYDEAKSSLWWISNAMILFGSAGYARAKQLYMEKRHKESIINAEV